MKFFSVHNFRFQQNFVSFLLINGWNLSLHTNIKDTYLFVPLNQKSTHSWGANLSQYKLMKIPFKKITSANCYIFLVKLPVIKFDPLYSIINLIYSKQPQFYYIQNPDSAHRIERTLCLCTSGIYINVHNAVSSRVVNLTQFWSCWLKFVHD
jgi:hypothetical protein